jgi:alpha-L-fucosidase
MYNKARFLLAPLGLGLLLSVPFAGCGSNDGTGNGAGGTGGKVGNTGGSNTGGGPSGGAGATSSGGSNASGGQTGNGNGTGGSGTGGARTGGSGGTSSSGSNTGGTQSGGAGGVGTGGAAGGSGTGGGTGTGGTAGSGTGGSATGGNATGGSSGYTAVPTCPALYDATSAGPPALQPHSSQAQSAYQHAELTSFIHLGMATFDNTEQGDMSKDVPSLFNPTNLTQDTVNAWVKSLKDAGFKQAMLTAKHSTGFCLWPSAYTDYSVKSSTWMSGKGDVVKMFTDAMHAAGMRVGLYLAPWDQKYPSSSANYETYYKNQLTELLSNYGPVYEIWADGANAPTNVNWKSIFALAKQLQPTVVAWAGPEVANVAGSADAQWIGNEQGLASRTTSSLDTSNCGKQANSWCAWEVDVSSRPGWFWHQSESPKPVSQVESIFFTSVGMNSNLIFNVPPSTTGEFDPKDVALLKQFGDWYSATFQTNLLKAQSATADSNWATAGFEAAKALDDDICTYWAAASGKTAGRLEVTPASAMTVQVISIREPIELGERVTKYHVELKQNGTWNSAPTDASGAKIQGTVVGQRQLWKLNSTSAQAIALVIESARGVPAISELSVY